MTETPENVTIGWFGPTTDDVVIVGEADGLFVSEEPVKYRRADLPPKVKGLGKDITVKTLFGSYFIEDQNYEYVLFFIPPTAKKRSDWQMLGAGEYWDMVNERQAHYESLVLSCLETTQ